MANAAAASRLNLTRMESLVVRLDGHHNGIPHSRSPVDCAAINDRPPALVSHTAAQEPLSTPPSLAEARRWTYEARFYAWDHPEVSLTDGIDAAVEQAGDDEWIARAVHLDVFRSPQVAATVRSGGHVATFAEPVSPNNVVVDAIAVDSLLSFLQALEGPPHARLEIWYRYGSPAVTLPVVLVPDAVDPSVADAAMEAVTQWLANEKPPCEEAELVLRFTAPGLRIEQAVMPVG